jgi:hypothetical protein
MSTRGKLCFSPGSLACSINLRTCIIVSAAVNPTTKGGCQSNFIVLIAAAMVQSGAQIISASVEKSTLKGVQARKSNVSYRNSERHAEQDLKLMPQPTSAS